MYVFIFHLVNSTDLVPEEEVALTELKVFQGLGLVEGDAHGIEAGEEPASEDK